MWEWVKDKFSTKVYKYRLKETTFYPFAHYIYAVGLGKWGVLNQKGLTIYKGYAHDGATPKIKIFGKVVGVWDGKNGCLEDATRVHDILCQFNNPLSRKEIDYIFYKMMKDVDFPFAWWYYIAVRSYSIIRRKK